MDYKTNGSDEVTSTDSDWDSQFPALTMKIHSTFTLTSNKSFNQKYKEISQKSSGDTTKVQMWFSPYLK